MPSRVSLDLCAPVRERSGAARQGRAAAADPRPFSLTSPFAASHSSRNAGGLLPPRPGSASLGTQSGATGRAAVWPSWPREPDPELPRPSPPVKCAGNGQNPQHLPRRVAPSTSHGTSSVGGRFYICAGHHESPMWLPSTQYVASGTGKLNSELHFNGPRASREPRRAARAHGLRTWPPWLVERSRSPSSQDRASARGASGLRLAEPAGLRPTSVFPLRDGGRGDWKPFTALSGIAGTSHVRLVSIKVR